MSIRIVIKGGEAIIDDDMIAQYMKDFQNVDVLSELKAIQSFMICNPQKRKASPSGVKQFVWCWLRNHDKDAQQRLKL